MFILIQIKLIYGHRMAYDNKLALVGPFSQCKIASIAFDELNRTPSFVSFRYFVRWTAIKYMKMAGNM